MTQIECLQLQQLNKNSYDNVMGKLQMKYQVRQRRMLLTRFGLSAMKADLVEVDFATNAPMVSYHRQEIDHRDWCSV